MLVECVGPHAFLWGEQKKVLAGYKPVKRTALTANRTIAFEDFFEIALRFKCDLLTMAAPFVVHWFILR